MKLIVIVSAVLLLSYPLIVTGQRETDNCLIVRSRVLEVPDSDFFGGNYPPEGTYIIVKYKVLKVLRGSYQDTDLKVSHGVFSSRKLRVGDQVVLEVRPYKDLREEADYFREVGIELSEERLANFAFVRFLPTFNNSSHFACTELTP